MKRFFLFLIVFFTFNRPVFCEDFQVRMVGRNYGLFSNLHHLIGILDAYDKEPFPFYVDFSGGLYCEKNRGDNWWEYYFEPINFDTSEEKRTLQFSGNLTANLAAYVKFVMPRERVNYLLNKYIKIKPNLWEKIEKIRRELFENSHIIAVHFRNTDKHLIYSPPNALETIRKVEQEILQSPSEDYKIFVATDDGTFLNQMIEIFGKRVVYADAFRSFNKNPLHGNRSYSPYKHGEEAIIDCMLLSKADVLIKTQSNLNEVASAWNLDLKVIDVEPQVQKWMSNTPPHNYLTKEWIIKTFRLP